VTKDEHRWPGERPALYDHASEPARRAESEPEPEPREEPDAAPEGQAEPEQSIAEAAPEPEAAEAARPEETDEPAAEAEVAPGEEGDEESPDAPVELAKLHGPEEHAAGQLDIPEDVAVLEGSPNGSRRGVAFVVARFNGEVTSRLLSSALEEAERAGVPRTAITVMPVPGAFELPLAAMALAKTRRYACVVALGCVIRGETPHFEYVAGEAASGLQLAALETGIPVSFGVLTVESTEQAEARIDKGAEAVRTALEMADVFSQLRQSAAATGNKG
jgi:6,7-dimethyl-8-ribityllumazine synthase